MVERSDMERRISAYQFALYDLGLYQDARPDDTEAQQLRTLYTDKLKKLIGCYEKEYGPYILTQSDATETWRDWVEDPWPWDNPKGGN